jgi:LacI family transcriptional regulator
MSRPRVTIQQLAQHLNLSKFSVSRALSGKGGVSEETRARVVRAATRLGYASPSQTNPGRQVLFVMQAQDPVSSELSMNMLHGAEREGAQRGLSVIARQANEFMDMSDLDPTFVGLVLAVNRPEMLLERAMLSGLPMVCAGYGEALDRIDHVTGADREGGVVVGRHLTGLGHRKIGFVRGEAGLAGRDERWLGLQEGAGETKGSDLRVFGFAEPNGFRNAFVSELEAGYAPTALFCAHDGLAITAISELMRLGIRVPEDISVVGFNDFACAIQIAPQLTTVRTPQEALGAMVIRCLAMRLELTASIPIPPLRIILAPEFVERRSTAPVAMPCWSERLDGFPGIVTGRHHQLGRVDKAGLAIL